MALNPSSPATKDVQALLFDMDGVLIDSFEAWYALVSRALRELGGRPRHIDRERYRATWARGTDADVSDYFPHLDVPALDEYYNRTLPYYIDRIRVLPGVQRGLRHLQQGPARLGCVTNTVTPLAEHLLRRLGLRDSFDVVVGPDRAGASKPSPAPVLLAARLLQVEPERCLFIGDSPLDRQAARAAGATFIGLGLEGDHPTIWRLDELPRLLA